MKLIIDITKEVYKNIQSRSTEIQAEGYTVENAVLNGTVLPENTTVGIDRKVIEDIKAEIEQIRKEDMECDGCSDMGMVLDIIDKHIKE